MWRLKNPFKYLKFKFTVLSVSNCLVIIYILDYSHFCSFQHYFGCKLFLIYSQSNFQWAFFEAIQARPINHRSLSNCRFCCWWQYTMYSLRLLKIVLNVRIPNDAFIEYTIHWSSFVFENLNFRIIRADGKSWTEFQDDWFSWHVD